MFKSTKRFIAGAVCPQCQKMDKLVMYREGDHSFRECVSCGFREEMLLSAAAQEPATRVSNSSAASAPEETQVVRLIDPSKP